MLSSATAWAQLASLLVGIVSSAIAILSSIRTYRKPLTDSQVPTQYSAPRRFLAQFPGDPQRNRQDLIAVLLICAVLSLTIIDALVVATGAAGIDENALLYAIAISSVVTVLGIVSWFYGVHYKTCVVLGLASLAALVLSRGGPFRPSDYLISRKGDSILLFTPLFTVTVIISALLIYGNGSLRRLSSTKLLVILMPPIIAASAQGVRFIRDVQSDPRTPHVIPSAERPLVKQIYKLSRDDQKALYSLASELTLSSLYSDPGYRSMMGITPPDQSKDQLIDDIRSQFSRLSTQDKLDYLISRARWVHPSGSPTEFQAPIGLPGLDSLKRVETTAALRNVTLLDDREAQRATFLKGYDYPSAVRTAFHSLSSGKSDTDVESVIDQVLGIDQPASVISVPDLFPMQDLQFMSYGLVNQLTLPLQYDLALAQEQYLQAAASFISDRGGNALSMIQQFQGLDQPTRNAFIHYVAKGKNPTDTIAAVESVADIDFGPVLSPTQPLPFASLAAAVDKAQSLTTQATASTSIQHTEAQIAPSQPSMPIDPMQAITQSILLKTADSRPRFITLMDLMRRHDDQAQVALLFSKPTLGFIRALSSSMNADQQLSVIQTLSDPVTFVLTDVVNDRKQYTNVRAPLTSFSRLNTKDQELLLHLLAISIYRAEGAYVLSPIQQMIADANAISPALGIFCSIAIFAPLFFVGTLLAQRGANRLKIRDALRSHIRDETQRPVMFVVGSELVAMRGRDDELARLKRLSVKNRSTIALTGRRGCGKSRILRELFRRESENGGVAVWIDSPSKYTRDEFVASLLERLAASVEARIAEFAGFPKQSIRTLERECMLQMFIIYGFLITGLAAISYAIFSALSRPDVFVLWSPVWILLIPTIGVLALEVHRIYPTGFGESLADKPRFHTKVLYQATTDVFRYLRARNSDGSNALVSAATSAIRLLTLIGIPLYMAVMIAPMLGQSSQSSWNAAIMGLIGRSGLFQQKLIECGILSAIWVAVYFIRNPSGISAEKRSTPGLIHKYREFAKEVVLRLGSGACASETGGVIVCIDELDKITDIRELKRFLSLAKTLFDIEGVSYYLSMADDALISLALGSAIGKDEFDSSFDHVERVPPLSFEDSVDVASQYCADQLHTTVPRAHTEVIGFLSFGVPRDIVRKCESALAMGILEDSKREIVSQLFKSERRGKCDAGYAMGHISAFESESLGDDLPKAAERMGVLIDEHPEGIASRGRLLAHLAILIMAEEEWVLLTEQAHTTSERVHLLFRLGFEAVTLRLEDLSAEIRRTWPQKGSQAHQVSDTSAGMIKPLL